MAESARVRTADAVVVRELAERATGPGKVLSVVIDLNPTEFADARSRRTQLTSLLDRARREIDADGFEAEERRALEHDIDRVEEYATSDLPADGVSGIAVFASEPRDMFDVVRLTLPAAPDVVIADDPAVETLALYLSLDVWGVLLVNSRTARVLSGRLDLVGETERFTDKVHGRHKQGGWSQARYQRSVEEEVEAHIRRSVERFTELATGQRFDHVAMAAPDAVRGHLEHDLPRQLEGRLAGMIDVDVEHATEDEIMDALRPLAEDVARRREAELLDRWSEYIGTGRRAVAGLPDVLKALSDKRVEVVLVSDSTEIPRIVVEGAVLQDAGLVTVRHRDDLDAHGGIAALLRF